MNRTHSRKTQALCLLGLLSSASVAQEWPEDTIIGCESLDCPEDGTPSPNCTIVDTEYPAVGLARIPLESDQPLSDYDISWLYAVSAESNGSGNRTFGKDFYLGTDPTLGLGQSSEIPACALFFKNTTQGVSFRGESVLESQGTCEEAMSEPCVRALNKRAMDLNITGLSTTAEICDKLQREFEDKLDSACMNFTTGKTWHNLTVVPLSGPESSDPITQEQNSTSNCWPVIPHSNDLTPVYSYNTTGDFSGDDILDNLFGIVPILTVFFPNNTKMVTEAESQMTCMKTISFTPGSNETKDDGSGESESQDGDDSSATVLGLPSAAVLGFSLFAALTALVL
ncbi:hypothetical protein ACJ41O_003895 [Fusarium nematophilum]